MKEQFEYQAPISSEANPELERQGPTSNKVDQIDTAPENEESILNDEDKKVIEFALHKLKDLLSKKEAEELPSTIILMDISARVLYYAIKPIINEVYKGKRDAPQYHFLLAVRQQEIPKLRKHEKADQMLGLETQKKNSLNNWEEVFTNRFSKILDISPTGNILIVDDYLSLGETLKKTQRVAGKILPPNRKLDFFAFFNNNASEIDDKGENNVYSGISRQEINYNKKSLGKELARFNGLSFTNKSGGGFLLRGTSKYVKEEVVGVRKTAHPYETVVRKEKVNIEGKKQLRREMEAMAKKVLADKNFDKKKEIDSLETDFEIFF